MAITGSSSSFIIDNSNSLRIMKGGVYHNRLRYKKIMINLIDKRNPSGYI